MDTTSNNASATAPAAGSHFDLVGLMFRKLGTIAFFVILAEGLAVLWFFKAPKTWESESKVSVEEKLVMTSSTESETFSSEANVEKYVEIAKSVNILRDAIIAGKLDELDSLLDSDDVLNTLRENLIVQPTDLAGKSGVFRIAYRGPDPEDCRTVLGAIVASFERYIDSKGSNRNTELVQTQFQLTEKIGIRIKEIDEQIQKLSAKPELLFRDGLVANQHQLQQARLQEELDLLRRERTRLSSRLESVQNSDSTGVANETLIAETLQELNDGALGGYITTHQEYLRLRMREQELLGQVGNDHPDLVALRKQIEVANEMRMQELAALRTGTLNGEIRDDVDVVTGLLQVKIGLIDTEIQSLQVEINAEQEKARGIAADVELLASLQRERARLEQEHSVAISRLTEINTLKDVQFREMEVFDPPTEARQVIPNLLVSIAGGLLIGSLLGFGFVALQEYAEKTFRSADEIASRLGTRVLAQVYEFRSRKKDPQHRSLGRDLLLVHDPGAVQAESFRALRTALFFKSQKDGARIIQITSPTLGDGKSQVSANLAVSVANSGRSVCLVDCDFRRPTQHDRFGLKNKIGVTSVLAGEARLDDAIQHLDIENLAVVPSGPVFANPSELLTTELFRELLVELSERFDFVIVDTPPLLPVTDPAIISNHVDAIFLVIRIRKGVQVNARRALEVLQAVNASIDGVVVNGIRKKDGFGERSGYGARYSQYGAYSYPPRKSPQGNARLRNIETTPEEQDLPSARS